MADSDLTKARHTAVRLLRKHQTASAAERTPILRQVADALVDARASFTQSDGSTDWTGQSHAYRQWVRELFVEAGIPQEERRKIQSSIRYHVSGAIRERLDEKTREQYGLVPRSRREQGAERRRDQTMHWRALEARDAAAGGLLSMAAAERFLRDIDEAELVDLDSHTREMVRTTLANVEKRARALRRRVESPT